MSVDGSFIQANADHHSRVPQEQLAEVAKVNCTVREYFGRAIVDAILAGQRDGAELSKLRDPDIKADTDALHRSLTPLGNYLRRMKAKLGPQAATMATAHKIAVIFYTMIKNQVEYDETIWDARVADREKKLQAKLKRQAKQLGYELVPIQPQAA